MNREKVTEYIKNLGDLISQLGGDQNYFEFSDRMNDIREKLSFCKHNSRYPHIIAETTLKLLEVENNNPNSDYIKKHIIELVGMKELYKDISSAGSLITQYSNMEKIDYKKRIIYTEEIFKNMPPEKGREFMNQSINVWGKMLKKEEIEEDIPNPQIVLTAYCRSLKDDRQKEELVDNLSDHGISVSTELKEEWFTVHNIELTQRDSSE